MLKRMAFGPRTFNARKNLVEIIRILRNRRASIRGRIVLAGQIVTAQHHHQPVRGMYGHGRHAKRHVPRCIPSHATIDPSQFTIRRQFLSTGKPPALRIASALHRRCAESNQCLCHVDDCAAYDLLRKPTAFFTCSIEAAFTAEQIACSTKSQSRVRHRCPDNSNAISTKTVRCGRGLAYQHNLREHTVPGKLIALTKRLLPPSIRHR